jgi:hypothetical protein
MDSKKSLREARKHMEQSCVIQAITYDSDHQQQILLFVFSDARGEGNALQRTSRRSSVKNGICIIFVMGTLMI